MSERPPACCPPSSKAAEPVPMVGEAFETELAAFAKAIAHPARVRIMRMLSEHTGCVCGDIVDEVGLAQSTVSQHLAVLKEAGLIHGDVDGPRMCYCLASDALRRFKMLTAAL